ncbi:MAG: hypothetical protein LBU39_07205 [Desulfobulbaceae bacterium]|jgi:TolB-like protein|nr:hypothetical protein [Desulfobulbaceae bacterium]
MAAIFRLGRFAPFLFLILVAAACSRFNGTGMESILGRETDLVRLAYTAADTLAATAMPPLVARDPDMPILTTTFVDNNDLTKTSRFGRAVQEHMASRFTQLGYRVREIKLAESMEIAPRQGETILSRDLRRLSPDVKAQAILVGTISRAENILYVSTRLIDPADASILSSTDYRLRMDAALQSMLDEPAPLVGGDRLIVPETEAVPEPAAPRLNSWFK